TLMARRDAIESAGGYREDHFPSEDLDLWLRLAERGRLANHPELLLEYRRHIHSISHSRQAPFAESTRSALVAAYRRRGLGPPPDRLVGGASPLSALDHHRSWAFSALRAGNVATARKHAVESLKISPLSFNSWRVAYCALRGR